MASRRERGLSERVYLTGTFAEERRIPRRQRVFCNRNLRLTSNGAIGFDLDHTLAHYDPLQVEELAFRATQQKLVRKLGYPAAVSNIRYDPEFVIRGLVIDRRKGNIVKMNYHKYVTRAFHGRKELSREQLETYRRARINLSSERFVSVDTLFHLPEVYLYLSIIDLLEERGEKPNFVQIYKDVRAMIDQAHADGSIKNVIRGNPSRFIRIDPKLVQVIDEFRTWGKKIFLLTNSEYYYADVLMNHLFHKRPASDTRHWTDFFDLIITEAAKPGFFDEGTRRKPAPIRKTTHPEAYKGGSARFLEERVGHRGDEILYFGDHTYGDILRAKKSAGWRTAMVVPELEQELKITLELQPKLRIYSGLSEERDRIDMERAALEREQNRLRMLSREKALPRVLSRRESKIAILQAEIDARSREIADLAEQTATLWRECERRYNRIWGPLFREGNEPSRFGHQVRDFACVYTSRASNFLFYSKDHYFRSPVDLMPHEM
ncbi:MAG: HAD-IG family 5'-nucleotidase [Candidatus Eisenbacteria bacterium]|nr:HAD-IG family 5'-nucleotidase [Candidatus Eisenbacteria bacterium]